VFCHPLFRECLYEGLATVPRAALHRALGETLRAAHAGALDDHLEAIASHYVAALPVGAAPLALEYCQLAARRASRLGARDEAVRLLERALEAVRLLDDDGGRWCEAALALADALERAGRVREARALFMEVAERAERLGLVRVMALAAAGVGGRLIWSRSADPREIPLLERALAALPEEDLALRGLLMARLSATVRDHARMAATVRTARQAVELARLAGDPAVLTRTGDALAFAVAHASGTGEALAAVDEYERSARASGDLEHQVQAHLYRAGLLVDAGDVTGAEGEVALALRMNETLRQPVQHWLACAVRAELALIRGRLDRAQEMAEEARRLGQEIQRPEGEAVALVTLYFVHLDQGRMPESESFFSQMLAALPQFKIARLLTGHLAAVTGRHEEARAFLDRHRERGFVDLLDSVTHRMALALLTEMAAMTGHAAAGAALEPLVKPLAQRYLAAPVVLWVGAARRYRGLLAALAGRRAEAIEELRAAALENRVAGSTRWALRCDLDLARLLLRGDAAGEVEEARALLGAARERAEAMGFVALAAEAGAQGTAPAPPTEASFRREGEFWTIAFAAASVRLRDSKGLRYLARLLAEEGRDFPALELMSTDGGVADALDGPVEGMGAPGDLGPVLDRQARGDVTRRLEEIEVELEKPAVWNDLDRVERLHSERDALNRELGAAVGLGGRDRRMGGPAERARQSVTKAIRGAMERIAREHQELGRHLGSTVRTGLTCRYDPDPRQPPRWRVQG
jgi:tetratricopeptide (TPR) repeat protein